MGSIKLSLLNIKKNFQNAKELKSTFLTSVVGMCINNFAFIILWYYFGTMVGEINGWKPFDIFGLYGLSGISYGLICTFFYGMYNIPNYISTGNFDRYLTTPKNTLLKVVTSDISTSAIGDLLFGFLCFGIYAVVSKLSIIQLFVSVLLMVITSVIFFAFSLICVSISFYMMDGENVSMGLYNTFLSASMYHGGAFTGILRIIFIFVMPSLLLGAIPVELIKDISISGILIIALLSVIWLIISVLFFYKSLKKYESNNFFGFGG